MFSQSIGGGGGNDDDNAVAVMTYASIIAMNLSQKGGRLGRQREVGGSGVSARLRGDIEPLPLRGGSRTRCLAGLR